MTVCREKPVRGMDRVAQARNLSGLTSHLSSELALSMSGRCNTHSRKLKDGNESSNPCGCNGSHHSRQPLFSPLL